MTRDEVEFLAKHEMFTTFSQAFLDHDAEQRQVIEQLRKELELLKADDAERCTLIRDMEEEIAKLRQSIQTYNMAGLEGIGRSQVLYERIDKQAQQIAALREALKELYALVQGECPRLLNEDSGGDAELGLKIEQALKEVNP